MAWPDRLAWASSQDATSLPDAGDDLAAWRDVVDPGGTGQFLRRLDLAGLSVAQARLVVSRAADRAEPDSEALPFCDAFLRACRFIDGEEEALWPTVAHGVPFVHVLWPGVMDAWNRFETSNPELLAPVGTNAREDLRLALLTRLGELLAPTLAQELTAGLTVGQRLLNRIGNEASDASTERYRYLCRELASGGLDALLVQCPVLPNLIDTVIRQWHEQTAQMLARVARHRDDLHTQLGIDPRAVVTGITISSGDRHNDGRSVGILSFGKSRVAYKPRDTRLEQFWVDVVAVLNRQLPDGGLRAARVVLGRDGLDAQYGFCEFVERAPCTTAAELAMFYVNAGRTLALLHALSATDCHFENLVACGDQLVLVDAEALFETRSNLGQAVDLGDEPILSTVLQVGMLPGWMWLEGERVALDITALGCSPGSTGRTTSRGWRAVNTGAMARGPIAVHLPHPVSLPTPDGIAPDLAAHVDDVVRGFEEGYRAVVAARETGLMDLLQASRSLTRRLIQRPTYVYAALLARAREPQALRSSVDFGMVLEQLARAYLASPVGAGAQLLEAEQRAMARLDVPLFETSLDGSHTRSFDARAIDLPVVSAFDVVVSRISALDEPDLTWQARLIRATFAAHGLRLSRKRVAQPASASGPGLQPRQMAERCRGWIADDALVSGGHVTWMTLALLPDAERVTVRPVGSGLYDGALGVAVFLHVVGEQRLARGALAPLLADLDPDDPARARRQLLAVGPGLSGAGGYLRAFRLLERQGHLDANAANRAVSAVIRATTTTSVSGDRNLDLMNGIAGLVAPLAAERTAEVLSSDDLDRVDLLIRTAADRLVAQQRQDGGWQTLPGSGPLAGLAHGASGIALALVEAATCLHEPRYLEAAMSALAFEDALFDAVAGNWPDLRDGAQDTFMLAWCSGAPGIALARLRLLDLLPDHPRADHWHREIGIAAATTAAGPMLERDHLCCGNLGRAAVLRTLGVRLGQQRWLDDAANLVEQVLARAGDGLPRSILGTENDVLAIPGLVTGQAGAGMMLIDDDPASWTAALLV